MERREFLKVVGAGSAALGATAVGCAPKKDKKAPVATGNGGMEYRVNPRNGDKISLLGYGCMRWPMIPDRNYTGNGRAPQVIDQEAVNAMVDRAYQGGVNYYDTSPAYLQGQSEKAAGIALSRYPRNTFYIATKLSNFGDNSWEGSKKMYLDSFEEMQTDYFDYYLLHNIGGGGLPMFSARYEDNGIMDFLLKERESGRIRNLGFSFHGNQAAFDDFLKLDDKYHWDFVQIQMNYVDWRHADTRRNANAEYLYEELDKREIPITVMEPLQGGRLASVPENITAMMKTREPDKSVASWAFRFVGSHPRVLTALSGMTVIEHVEENLETFTDFQYLSEEEYQFLEEMAVLMREYPMVDCNDCKYCMPCPYGLDIPEIFKHYNKCVSEGLIAQNAAQEGYKKLRRRYLLSYDRAVAPVRQADHCTGCNQCVEHCPQSLRIPQELQRIDNYVEKLRQGLL